MAKQYVSVKFNPWDRKSYTYHWESFEKALEEGDKVHVLTKDGRVEAIVETVNLRQPDFITKPILGRAE